MRPLSSFGTAMPMGDAIPSAAVRNSTVMFPFGIRASIGLVIVTLETVIATLEEVVLIPWLSVATALSWYDPGYRVALME